MSFHIEFYDTGECDRCEKSIANIHLELTTRRAAERHALSFCWNCWEKLNQKVFKQWHQPDVDRDIPNSIKEQS